MNRFDFYFKQIVSQGDLDLAFEWAEDADLAIGRDVLMSSVFGVAPSAYGGILNGGRAQEQTVPDLTVQVGSIIASAKDGRRLYDATPSVNVDLSQDEYGTSTEVSPLGFERIISLFVRHRSDLQNPKVDGNGLTVYTNVLEDIEYFVRMGADSVPPATPPALLDDALLIADFTRANGQTTIQDTDRDESRREDWIRLVGSTIPAFVHGSAKSAIMSLFNYVDIAWGGGLPFTFSQDWYGSVAPGQVLGTPSTMPEALDTIVADLASTSWGSALIGTPATSGTPGGYGDFSATSVAGMLINIATLIAGHINGGLPQHAASVITTDAYNSMRLLHFSDTGPLSFGNWITNSAGGQGFIEAKWPDWCLVSNISGSWPPGAGVDDGLVYSAPPDTYFINDIALTSGISAADVQQALQDLLVLANRRPEVARDAPVIGSRWHTGELWANRIFYGHCHLPGGGNAYQTPQEEMADGCELDGSEGQWGHPYGSTVYLPNIDEIVDIARGWDYYRNTPCVYVTGDESSGNCVVSRVFLDQNDDDFIDAETAILTGDAAGTPLITVNPNAEVYAVCSDGPTIFVLASASPAGSSAAVHAYDATSFIGNGSVLRWLWTSNLPFMTNALGLIKSYSRIRCSGSYVYTLHGDEFVDAGGPGRPLGRMNKSDGSGAIIGLGEGHSTAAPSSGNPTGGLCVSRNGQVFYTADSGIALQVVPATITLGITGNGIMGVTGNVAHDVLIPGGRYVVCPGSSVGADFFVEFWEWASNTKNLRYKIQPPDATYTARGSVADFDGTKLWVKFPMDLSAITTGENHAIFGIHAAEFQLDQDRILPRKLYQATEPRFTGQSMSNNMGRICAWGPGIWGIEQTALSNEVTFLPFSRLD